MVQDTKRRKMLARAAGEKDGEKGTQQGIGNAVLKVHLFVFFFK